MRFVSEGRGVLNWFSLVMANTISSIKRIRQAVRATAMNRQSKSRLRSQIRLMRTAVSGKDPKAAEALLPKTFSLIDRSARIGIIKKNTAARYKSKLHKRLKALTPSEQK
jgi:small subunit ribosomal protein S20